jgi:type IV secretion system protein VirB2
MWGQWIVIIIILALLILPDTSVASEGSGGGLPYESWLITLKDSLTGPVAYVIGILGILGAGAMLMWGGEISGFMKSMIYVVLVMALLVGANSIMANLFGKACELACNSILRA